MTTSTTPPSAFNCTCSISATLIVFLLLLSWYDVTDGHRNQRKLYFDLSACFPPLSLVQRCRVVVAEVVINHNSLSTDAKFIITVKVVKESTIVCPTRKSVPVPDGS